MVERGIFSARPFVTCCSLGANDKRLLHVDLKARRQPYLSRPLHVVLLELCPKVAMGRLVQRSRAAEKGVSLTYLEQLTEAYRWHYEEPNERLSSVLLQKNVHRVAASADIEAVGAKVVNIVQTILTNH